MSGKIRKLQQLIARQNLDAIIITNPANIFYLTGIDNFDSQKGFFLLVFQNKWRLISSLFYQKRIAGVIPKKNIVYIPRQESLAENAAKLIGGKKNIGFERGDISYARYEIFKKFLRGKKLIPTSDASEQFRQIKSEEEIQLIKKATQITDKTFAQLLKLIKPGAAELFLKRKILEMMQDMGAQKCSFDPIVASGKNSADPHYEGSNKKIKTGEMIVIDLGARHKNYCADMTRTVFLGKASAKYKERYNLVLQTQQKAIAQCHSGFSPNQAFENAGKNFADHGQDQFFTHGLGHGVGINLHELPSLSPAGTGVFENNMVFTVEPGLYHLGWGGIRVEDLCAMQNNKCTILSKTEKNLIEIRI